MSDRNKQNSSYKGKQQSRNDRGRGKGRGKNSDEQTSSQPIKKTLPPLEYIENCTYIDTHVHLEYILEKVNQRGLSKTAETASEKVFEAFPVHANFEGCIAVFCDATAFSPSLAIWPEFLTDHRVWGAFGLHPHSAKYWNKDLEERIISALQHERAVAWGECGLDFIKMNSEKDIQIEVFGHQVKRAVEIGMPIMIHSRGAPKETLQVLLDFAPSDHPIHLHCFADTADDAEIFMKHFTRLYFGITGMVTWEKSEKNKEVIVRVPLERLLLETDGPYFFPADGNSKTINHPGTIPAIAQAIATLKKIPLDTVYHQIRQNTKDVYSI